MKKRFLNKLVLALTLAVAMLAAFCAGALADPVAQVGGKWYDTLAEAVEKSASGDTIILAKGAAISLDAKITVEKEISLYFFDSTINAAGTGTAFHVRNGGKLSFVGDGKLTRTGSKTGSAVIVSNGTEFVLDGVEISGFSSPNGGGVSVSGTFTMKSGSIANCTSTGTGNTNGGGAVYVQAGAVFVMEGGSLRNNVSRQYGGAVYNQGTFTMKGGRIEGNKSNAVMAWGAAIYNQNAVKTTISGGVITGNTGYGAVVSRNDTLVISGGAIYLNPFTYGSKLVNNVNNPSYMDVLVRKKTMADTPNRLSICAANQMSDTEYDLNGWSVNSIYNKAYVEVKIDNAQAAFPQDNLPAEWKSWNDSIWFNMDAVKKTPDPDPDGVYLNGISGDDTQGGSSPVDAVKTFEKARELAQASGKPIFICGTVTISGPATLTTSAKVMRYPYYEGYLFEVEKGAELTLKDITIDGNRDGEKELDLYTKKNRGLLYVQGTLNIESGAKLQNNNASAASAYFYDGGAVYCDGGTVNMTGGEISDNESSFIGGGITVVHQGKVNMSGGKISGNKAKSYGGGICAIRGSAVTLEGDALIQGNTAAHGGGIQLGGGTSAEAFGGVGQRQTLVMDGGRIDGNIADGGTGGGLYVQMNSKATIHSGYITNNKADNRASGSYPYRGGGVYVNGGKSYGYSSNGDQVELTDGILQLYNVEITDNHANASGGGLAACPTANVEIYVNQGGVIHGNTASQEAQQVMIEQEQAGDPALSGSQSEVYISDFMLGGGMYQWLWDKKGDAKVRAAQSQYQHPDRAAWERIYLDNICHPDDVAKARSMAKTFITGNSTFSDKGGGIAANGTVIIGDSTEQQNLEGGLSVVKTWEDNGDSAGMRPTSITADIRYGDYVLRGIELTAANNWTAVWDNLPNALVGQSAPVLTVMEVKCPEYSLIKDSPEAVYDAANRALSIAFANRFDPTKGDLTVSKTVSGDGADETKAFDFTIELDDKTISGVYGDLTFKDGVAAFTLKHGESKKATGLPKGVGYTVTERQLDDCIVTMNGVETDQTSGAIAAAQTAAVAVDNRMLSRKDIPQTGDNSRLALWMTLALMSAAGLSALVLRRKNWAK